MSVESDEWDADTEIRVHSREGSVFMWPSFELVATFESTGPDDRPVYYFYPRSASDSELESQWIVADADFVVDLVDVR